jgi:hypothetical protein
MSEDQATNKAVREHNQLQVEYSSEQKESIVSRGLRQQAANTGETVIHRFEDLLSPAADLMKGLFEKSKGVATSEEVIRTGTYASEKSTVMERTIELRPAVRKVLGMIHEHLQGKNPVSELEIPGRSFQSRMSDGGSKMLAEPQVAGSFDKSRDRLSANLLSPGLGNSKLFLKAGPSMIPAPRDKLENHRVMRLNSPRIGGELLPGKSLLNVDREKQAKRAEEKADVVSWVKSMQTKGLFKLKSQASTFFEDSGAQTGVYLPLVATFQSIPRIFFFFAVVSFQPEERTCGR